jgi:hypothetical protein
MPNAIGVVFFGPALILAGRAHAAPGARAHTDPDNRVPTTAMSGPHATAFDDRCGELRAAYPKVICERAQHASYGQLVLEVFKTTGSLPDPDQPSFALWLTIGTELGWFTVKAPLQVRTTGGNGTGSVSSSATVDSITVRGASLAGRRAAILEVRQTWTIDCIECAPRQKTVVHEADLVVCQLGPVGIGCTDTLQARGPAPVVRIRNGTLDIDGVSPTEGIAKGRYTLSPP